MMARRLRREWAFFCAALVALIAAGPALRAGSVLPPIALWPNGAPGDSGIQGPEKDITKQTDYKVDGKWVTRLINVTNPTITVYKPSRSKANGAAVVVCPGGGYHILATDLEGTEVCQWLNSLGVTAALLKYRVPQRTNDGAHFLPLEDAQRAVRLVRSHAAEWKLDPQRIGILGFSAGGHLAARESGNFDAHLYEAVDEADQISARPDFTLLIYPAYLFMKGKHLVAPELNVSSNNPPTFMVQTEDDVLGVESCVYNYLALKNAKVPVEMHLYPAGGHGYGLRPSTNLVSTWPLRAGEWMKQLGVLRKR